MTKCSVFPRVFGTLPDGSAVRVKSRFALYSASGGEVGDDRAVRFGCGREADFVASPVGRAEVFRALVVRLPAAVPRLAGALTARVAGDLAAFFAPAAVPRLAPRVVVRLVAIARWICQERAP